MKQMSRDPSARSKALRAERRADEKSGLGLITIKPLGTANSALDGGGNSGSGSGPGATTKGGPGGPTGKTERKGFKKGGFRNAFGGGAADDAPGALPSAVSSKAETRPRDEKASGASAAASAVKIEIDMGPGTGTGAKGEHNGNGGSSSSINNNNNNATVGIVEDDPENDDAEMDESDNNEESAYAAEGGRYDPSRPTGCEDGCRGRG